MAKFSIFMIKMLSLKLQHFTIYYYNFFASLVNNLKVVFILNILECLYFFNQNYQWHFLVNLRLVSFYMYANYIIKYVITLFLI